MGLPMAAIIGICIHSFIQHGLTWRMLLLLMMFWAGYLYSRFGLNILGHINFLLWFPAGICLWLSFLLWNPSEHLPFGADAEYPHSAGLAFGTVIGGIVVLISTYNDEDGNFLESIIAMRHYLVLLSVVAVAGYATFLPYSYAMYQVFTEGNYLFTLLALFSIIAFLAFAHNRAKSPTVALGE